MLAVLGGAFLHASWNIIAKAGRDKRDEIATMLIGGALLACVMLAVLPWPAMRSLPFMMASGVVHLAYFGLLAAAYEAGDLSLAYPLMRGVPPLLVTAASAIFLSERLAAGSLVGIGLISAGVLGLAAARAGRAHSRVVGLALLNCLVIAAYTLIDATGARHSGAPFAYTAGVFVANTALFVPLLLCQRGLRVIRTLKSRWPAALGGGLCSLGAYGVALWAMSRAPIGPVAALRETSILFGIALSMLVLGERPGAIRLASAALILGGVVVLRLA